MASSDSENEEDLRRIPYFRDTDASGFVSTWANARQLGPTPPDPLLTPSNEFFNLETEDEMSVYHLLVSNWNAIRSHSVEQRVLDCHGKSFFKFYYD